MHTRWPHKDRGHNRHWLSLGEILRVKNNAWAAPIAGHKYIGYALASSTLGRHYITGIGKGGGEIRAYRSCSVTKRQYGLHLTTFNERMIHFKAKKSNLWLTYKTTVRTALPGTYRLARGTRLEQDGRM